VIALIKLVQQDNILKQLVPNQLMMDVKFVQKEHFQSEGKKQNAQIKLAQKILFLKQLERSLLMKHVLNVQKDNHLKEIMQFHAAQHN